MTKISHSIIVPVYNEAGNIIPLFKKLSQTFQGIHLSTEEYEIIFVNDGSSDTSKTELDELRSQYSQVKVFTFTRNFGQTAAWAAGIDHAKGAFLITIDADLQNDPADIPMMLQKMEQEQADIVTGWRKNRQDPFLRSIFSKIANRLINWIMGATIIDAGCSLRIIRKEAIAELVLYGEMHRLLPFILTKQGAKIVQVPVAHYPRVKGTSKYGFNRTFKVILDVITISFLSSYQTKPMYVFGSVGLFFFSLSGLSAFFVLLRKLILGGEWISPLFFVMTNFFTISIVMIMMGLLAEVQLRTWYESSNKKSYILKQ